MCLYIIKFIFILIIMSKIENYIHINNNPKINIDKLLNKKIKHTDYMYKDILLFLSNSLLKWIDNNHDLDRFIDDETYHKYFNLFIYSEYITPHTKYNYKIDDNIIDYFEHFSSTYNDEIIDIYLEFKLILTGYNMNLFNNTNDSSYPFNEFIFSICDYKDPYNGEIDDKDNLVSEDDPYYR